MCNSCNVINIQGVPCHETGCPDAYVGHLRECKNCETFFIPESREEIFCSVECCRDYWGFSDSTDTDEFVTDDETVIDDFSAFDDIEIDLEYVAPLYELIRGGSY